MWRNRVYNGTLRAKSEDGLTGEQLDHYLYQLSFSIRYNHIAKMSQLHDTDYISSGVYLGDGFTAKDRKYLVEHGFTHVLNAAEGSDKYQVNTSQQYYQNSNIKYFGVPGHDRPSWNISIYFESASQFIDEAVKSGGKVLVHCVVGISRSATLVVAYLMMCKGMDVKEALAFTLRQRNINPNIGFLRHLADLNQKLKSRKKNSLTGVSKE